MVGNQLHAVVRPCDDRVVDHRVVDGQRVLEVAQLAVLHARVVAREHNIHTVRSDAHRMQQQTQRHTRPAVAAKALQA